MKVERIMELHRLAIGCSVHDESDLADAVREEGTLDFIRDVAERQYTDPMERAMYYLWTIANWHPFVEGNKRTAWITAQASLEGKVIECYDVEEYNRVLRSMAEGNRNPVGMAWFFKDHIIDYDGDPVEYVLREQSELMKALSR